MDIILQGITEALLWALLAIGVYLMYGILDIADLSVEGVFPLGAAFSAILLVANTNPILATLAGMLIGGVAGLVTGLMHTKLKIPFLLTGILMMSALYSINLRIMNQPNISLSNNDTIYSLLENIVGKDNSFLCIGLVAVIIIILVLFFLYKTELGLAFIATGNNEVMAQANGINTNRMKIIGYVISSALVGLSGSLLSQYNGFADIQSGVGTIVIGLAAVIIAMTIFKDITFTKRLLTIVIGAIIYRLVIVLVLEFNIEIFNVKLAFEALDLKLISAVILTIFICLPKIKIKKGRS